MSNETTPAVPTWKAEFDSRITAFAEATSVAEDKVREIFSNLGVDGQTDQSLTIIESDEFLPMADLFESFVDSKLTQKSKLRFAMPHLRGKTHLGETSDTVNGSLAQSLKDTLDSQRPLATMSDSELLDRYDDSSTEVWKLLRERTHGRNCIVYNANTINKEVSLKLVKIARRQATSNHFEVDRKLVRVYRAGEFPDKPLEESPFYPGRALVEGFCAESNTNWEGVSHELRVLSRIVCEVEGPLNKRDMREICRDTKSLTIIEFRAKFTEAALVYDEKQDASNLPDLKVRGGSSKSCRHDSGF